MNKCKICKKKADDFGLVFYDGEFETYLCRLHYSKWLKQHKTYLNSHSRIKPNTKVWVEMCIEEQNSFNNWLEAELKKLE